MSYRRFLDDAGVLWTVWCVYPQMAERRAGRERREMERSGPDRRQRTERRALLPANMQQGWLTFQSGRERRRLPPGRDDLDWMPDGELRSLLAAATSLGVDRRLTD